MVLQEATTLVAEDFEIRICKNQNHAAEDIAVEKLELYVL